MSGWISLHRKIRQNPVFNDVQLLRLWLICLMEASHKEHKILVGKQTVELKIGQFVTGRFELGSKYNDGLKKEDRVSESTVWRWLKTLENLEFLHINSNTKFSLCTVVKWSDYQNVEQQNEQPMNSRRTADEQPMTTNNNGNKGNNENKGNKKPSPPKSKIYGEESNYYQMADYFKIKVQEHAEVNKVAHLVANPNMQTWSDDFRKIVELDKRDTKELKAVIDFATKDPFWSTNILSPSTLRKQYVKLVAKLSSTSLSKPNGNYSKDDKNKSVLQKAMEEALNEQGGNNQIIIGDQQRLL